MLAWQGERLKKAFLFTFWVSNSNSGEVGWCQILWKNNFAICLNVILVTLCKLVYSVNNKDQTERMTVWSTFEYCSVG